MCAFSSSIDAFSHKCNILRIFSYKSENYIFFFLWDRIINFRIAKMSSYGSSHGKRRRRIRKKKKIRKKSTPYQYRGVNNVVTFSYVGIECVLASFISFCLRHLNFQDATCVWLFPPLLFHHYTFFSPLSIILCSIFLLRRLFTLLPLHI